MRKNTKAYVEKNQKKYEYYIKNINRKKTIIISWIGIFIIGLEMVILRNILLEKRALEEAGKKEIGSLEVVDWVAQQVEMQRFKGGFIGIVAACVVLALIVLWIHNFVKSYELYKWRKRKLLPMAIVISLAIGLFIENGNMDMEWVFITFVELLPLASNFSIFFPLEVRKGYNWFIDGASRIGNWVVKGM